MNYYTTDRLSNKFLDGTRMSNFEKFDNSEEKLFVSMNFSINFKILTLIVFRINGVIRKAYNVLSIDVVVYEYRNIRSYVRMFMSPWQPRHTTRGFLRGNPPKPRFSNLMFKLNQVVNFFLTSYQVSFQPYYDCLHDTQVKRLEERKKRQKYLKINREFRDQAPLLFPSSEVILHSITIR
jgi:hypothetical protein